MLGKLGGLRHSLKVLFCLQDSNLLISWGKVSMVISETMLSGPELTVTGLFLEEEGMDIFDSVAVLGDSIGCYINLEHLSHTERGPRPARLEVTRTDSVQFSAWIVRLTMDPLSLLPHDQSCSSDLEQKIKGDCGINGMTTNYPCSSWTFSQPFCGPLTKPWNILWNNFTISDPRHLPISHARTLKFIWDFISDRNLHFLGYLCIFAHYFIFFARLPINCFPSWERSCNISPKWLCPLQAEYFKVCWRCEYLLASSGTHSHTLALERVFHQNYKLQQPWSFEVERTKLNHCMPRVDWLGLTWILGAKPDPLH